jgi:threonine/homoserine/homoserine lactone efflux protein
MIAPQHVLPYIISAMAIILIPGPSVLFTIARAISWGRTIAVLTVLGNTLGVFVLSIGVALGLGPILQNSDLLYSLIQIVGGAYIIWLGLDAIRHRVAAAESIVAVQGDAPTKLKTVQQGFVVGILNPKVIVFFAAVLPHFVDPTYASITSQLFALGAVFCVFGFTFDSLYGLLAGTARDWFASSPNRLVKMRSAGGVVMMMLGLATVLTAPRPW